MIDPAVQRANMVESQVRPSDVTDRRVIRAMAAVARERFVPETLRSIAYADQDLVVSRDCVLPAPRLAALMIQALELGDEDIVLEVANGTGYGAAVLARIAQTVVALEEDTQLAEKTGKVLQELGTDNVAVVSGPLASGYEQEGPYDAILISGAIEVEPTAILNQLKDGGRLVAVVSTGGMGRMVQWRRSGGTFASRALLDATLPVLPSFAKKPEFVF